MGKHGGLKGENERDMWEINGNQWKSWGIFINGDFAVSENGVCEVNRLFLNRDNDHPLELEISFFQTQPRILEMGEGLQFAPILLEWLRKINNWLVVWNIFYFPIYWE